MVIGLNGRIPLNTAGNLAGQVVGIPVPPPPATPTYSYGGGPAHAQHLGNSVSEIDPTYGLQNGFNPNPNAQPWWRSWTRFFFSDHSDRTDSQVDTGGIDVRLTQLRNLLAGTRPQPTPGVPGLKAGALTGRQRRQQLRPDRRHSLLHAQ